MKHFVGSAKMLTFANVLRFILVVVFKIMISIVKKYAWIFVLLFLVACTQKEDNDSVAMTPWGTVAEVDADTMEQYSLEEILQSGQLRALSISGEETYFTYNKATLGHHYLLGEKLASELGVELKVEECADTLEMVTKLRNGDADLILMPISKEVQGNDSLIFCGPQVDNARWAVMKYSKELAKKIDDWYVPDMLAEVKEKQSFIENMGGVQCHEYEPFLDRKTGVISQWDELFKTYAQVASTDWRLLAAICYQESCFDPKARSWAGACGLMQIMPETAEAVGLPVEKIFDPKLNVEAAAKVVNQLTMLYRDVPDNEERMNFVLASYNGGPGHVRDAMALTEKNGGDPYIWAEVAEYILKLSQPMYYRDAVVKYGYMRGTETHDYVDKVRSRYEDYAGVALSDGSFGVNESGGYAGVNTKPTRRTGKQNKYQI